MRRQGLTQRPEGFRLDSGNPLANGLVFAGLGRFQGSTRYDDASGYGNHGTLTNMAPASDWVWIPELGRWGLDFDGTDDFVQTVRPAVTSEPFTFLCFFLPRNFTSAQVLIDIGTSSSTRGRHHLYYRGDLAGDPVQAFTNRTVSDSGAGSTTDSGISSAIWAHAAGNWASSASRTAYLNAVPAATNVDSHPVTGIDRGRIGLRSSSAEGLAFNGIISDPLIYSRALSEPEIQQIADPSNAMLSGLVLPPRRKWWPVIAAVPPSGIVPVIMHHRRMQGAA